MQTATLRTLNWNALFLGLIVALGLLPDFHPLLQKPELNQLGEATLKGEDIGARVNSFNVFILSFLASAGTFTLIGHIKTLKMLPALKNWYAVLAVSGIILSLCSLWNKALYTIIGGILICLAATFILQFFVGKNLKVRIILFLTILLSLLIWQQLSFVLPRMPLPLHGLILLGLQVVIGLSLHNINFTFLSSRLFWLRSAPILPFLPFLTVEFRYGISVHIGTTLPLHVCYILLLLLIMGGVFILKSRPVSWKKLMRNTTLCAAGGLSIYGFYQPYGVAPTEMYEMANRVLPLQEMHLFNVMPLFEKLSSHFVSDYGFGLLYQIIYGFQGLDFLIFDVFEYLLWAILLYATMHFIFKSNALAFAVCLLFPFADAIFSVYYIPALLPFFMLLRLIRQNSLKNQVLFAITLIFLVPWRADLSVAYLGAMAMCLIPIGIKKVIPTKKWILVLTAVFLLFSVFCLLICIALNLPWVQNITSILDYLNSSQSYGLVFMGDENHFQWKTHHLLLPIITAFTALIALIRCFQVERKAHRLQFLLLIFVSVFTLINIPRGLVRHGFAESTDNFLLSLGLIGLPLLFLVESKINPLHKAAITVGVWSVFAIWIRFPERLPSNLPISSIAAQSLRCDTLNNFTRKQRLVPDTAFMRKNISEISSFLNSELQSGGTFLDFTNTPMLHFYTRKEVPSFVYQNPQNLHSMSMQRDWVKRVKNWDIRLILYKHDPPNWWDATDGVPNEKRHKVMHDYIVSHYEFYRKLGGYEVWRKKASK
ncbi:MAG: hypothetical protein ACK5CY_06850 [Bacteroidia bacterium]